MTKQKGRSHRRTELQSDSGSLAGARFARLKLPKGSNTARLAGWRNGHRSLLHADMGLAGEHEDVECHPQLAFGQRFT